MNRKPPKRRGVRPLRRTINPRTSTMNPELEIEVGSVFFPESQAAAAHSDIQEEKAENLYVFMNDELEMPTED